MTKLDIKRFSNKSHDVNAVSDATYSLLAPAKTSRRSLGVQRALAFGR
jgi:hypothetical protein